ncbi:hypothetical protein NLX86_05055 [Streptomyces sp. A3M-1-3]|uniref:hypothetical protein n=1 Tax=Streptomyces sp. A3M-1-3 TaxID=2962044 RepID=UPI0020B720DA|nr:hypothetical protein [Streptomyces sp. A3M-1-3]MCP3817526.1 hypothetical protein [Streptomyces sp. A3M-1-3]
MPRAPRNSTTNQAPELGATPRSTPAAAPPESADTDESTMLRHITPLKRDMQYDHEAAQAVLPVRAHFSDGRVVDTTVVFDPDQMQVFSIQLERAIAARQHAFSKTPW